MLRTSLTANVRRQSQGNGALESMEALSAPTIGTNVLRARAQGSPKRLVAAFATAPAGCTPTPREGARTPWDEAETGVVLFRQAPAIKLITLIPETSRTPRWAQTRRTLS